MPRAIPADLGIDTPYGKIIQDLELDLKSGKTLKWPAAHPGALLTYLCTYAAPFMEHIADSIKRIGSSPSKPWRINFYADEAAAGALLKLDLKRKSWMIYWSFLEFGPEFLAHESNWFTLGLLRVTFTYQVVSGISYVVTRILEEWFFSEFANITERGFLIRCGVEVVGIVFAVFGAFLADEAALHGIWRSMGSSGNVNCMCCHNNMRMASGLADLHDTLIDSSEYDVSKFDLATDESIYDMIEKLRTAAPGEVADLEMQTGFHKDLHAILFNVKLRNSVRPISHTMYDGCHVLMCHGTVHFEMTAFWIAVKAQSLFSFADINDEFQKWSWPKSERNPPYRLFNNVHAKHSDWKGGASECLAMYQLFLWIVCDLLEGTEFLVKELKSLKAMFLVLDGWKAIQGGFVGSHLKFREAVMNHLRLYVEAYGRLACKPKHHMEIMLAVQLLWFGFLLGTSTAERKHKHYK